MTNTQKKTNRVGPLLPLFYVAAPTLAALRSVACIQNMDGAGYFGGSALMIACNVAIIILSLLFLTHALSHQRKDSVPEECFCNSPTYVTSATLGGGIIFAIYELVISLMDESGQIKSIENSDITVVVSAICGIAALVFLLLNAIIETKHNQVKAALGIAASVFFSTYGLCIYLDSSVAANMQGRIISVLSLELMAVFMLYEARIPLGHSKWHSYAAFGLAAAIVLAYSSIPSIAYYIATGNTIPSTTLTQSMLSLTAAVYVTARVTVLAFAPEDEICDLADSILDMAHRRGLKSASHARVNNLKEE